MPDHIGVDSTNCKVAIITGDPTRIPTITEQFDSSIEITDARGFLCAETKLGDLSLLVVSTGIGSPSTAIVVEELVELGINCIIRLGTCGALQRHINPNDLVISTACVRDEGTTHAYISPSFPAVADHVVLSALLSSAEKLGLDPHVGITHCKDSYYSERYEKQLDPHEQGRQWAIWRTAGVLATEMEVSPLFVIGSLRQVRTGAVLVAVGETRLAGFSQVLGRAVTMIQDAIISIVERINIQNKARVISSRSFLDHSEEFDY